MYCTVDILLYQVIRCLHQFFEICLNCDIWNPNMSHYRIHSSSAIYHAGVHHLVWALFRASVQVTTFILNINYQLPFWNLFQFGDGYNVKILRVWYAFFVIEYAERSCFCRWKYSNYSSTFLFSTPKVFHTIPDNSFQYNGRFNLMLDITFRIEYPVWYLTTSPKWSMR